MDVSKMTRGHWLVLVGTLAAAVGSLLLPWYSFGPVNTSAWSSGGWGKLAVLGMLVMVIVLAAAALGLELPHPITLPVWMLGAGAFTAVISIIRYLTASNGVAFGLWLTLIASIVTAYGGWELGGRLRAPSGITSSQH